MAHTVARVSVNGLPYVIKGAEKETVTDVTVGTNSETVTAASLGLSRINSSRAQINTGQATDTGTYVKCTDAATGANTVVAEFVAAGTAATTAADTVIRVHATGY